jgi:class 3 adenylate cyclase/Tol biopolymer transport system component
VQGGTVTFLFTDLVGSTQLIETLGDDTSDPLIRGHLKRLRAIVSMHRGRVVKSLGDGLMASFSSAAHAVDAAVHMQQVVAASASALEEGEAAAALELRVGINSGEAVYDGIDYYGKPVWVAQRYCDAATGGQILVSEVVRELVGTRGSHSFTDRGSVALRGVTEPARALQVEWQPDPAIDLAALDSAPEATDGARPRWVRYALPAALVLAAVVAAAVLASSIGGEREPSLPGSPEATSQPEGRRPVTLRAYSLRLEGSLGDAEAGRPSLADGRSYVVFATESKLVRDDTNGVADVYLYGRDRIPRLVSAAEEPGNGPSVAPQIAADGSRVVFSSRATNLVPGVADGIAHVYLYTVETGELQVVSRRSNGDLAVRDSSEPAISGNGSVVAFASPARNLAVVGDANGEIDVFRHDVNAGVTNRVSVPGTTGAEPNGPSTDPAVSPDGFYVGFTSRASNLVERDGPGSDVFYLSPLREAVKVSAVDASEANGPSHSPSVAREGRAIAFVTEASDLVSDDTNGVDDVLVATPDGLERVSVSSDGAEANGASFAPAISSNGRYVAFLSDASDLIEGDTNDATDAFLRDLEEGTTVRLSLTTRGAQVSGETMSVSLARDGRSYAFVAPAGAVDPVQYPEAEVPTVFVGAFR